MTDPNLIELARVQQQRDELRAENERLRAEVVKLGTAVPQEAIDAINMKAVEEALELRAEVARLKDLSKHIHAMAWENGASTERARLQPLLSVLGDWDWGGIANDWPVIGDYERAIEAVVKAMAEVERSVAKEQG